jgi:hypothetical protein
LLKDCLIFVQARASSFVRRAETSASPRRRAKAAKLQAGLDHHQTRET